MTRVSKSTEKEFAFTQKRIEALPLPETGRVEYRDTKTPGLLVRVTSRGKKTFYFRRWADGAMKRVQLGVFPKMAVSMARDLATKTQNKIYAGIDVLADRRRRRSCTTFQEAFDFYLEQHAKPRKRTWPEDQAQYDRYVKKKWATRRLDTIRRPDVAALHAKIGKEHGIYVANRTRSMIGKIFNVAIDAELFDGPNPTVGVKKFREQSRDRFLDAAELKRFFSALADEPNLVIRDYLKLSLLIGARRSNMLTMRWADIDLGRGVWRIPQTKSGEPQIVPLSTAAMSVLGERLIEREKDCPWVFPSTGNHPSKSGHLKDPTVVWKEILKRAELEDVRLHDLRRTLASWQAMLGTSELIIGKTLGHAVGSTATKVYARLQHDTIRESVELATNAILEAANYEKPDGQKGGDNETP